MSASIILSFILFFFLITLVIGTITNSKINRMNSAKLSTDTSFSIVIACKNEEHNLPQLFSSLRNIRYRAAYEVILIDDNSVDSTFDMMRNFCLESSNFHAYRLDNNEKGKKRALQYGIDHSNHDWILLTDADCFVPMTWLEEINKRINLHSQKDINIDGKQVSKKQAISMYIGYSPEVYQTSFQYFKQVATAINYAASTLAGMPVSCNGRNLILNKKVFKEVGGLNGLYHYPAGEDKLLMQRFKKYNKKIGYIPSPPVFTYPVEKEDLRNQNLRRFGVFTLSTKPWVFGMSLIGVLFFLLPIELFFKQNYLHNIVLLVIIQLYMVFGCILHKEKLRFLFFIYTVVFPYYLGYQIVRSKLRKWKWK